MALTGETDVKSMEEMLKAAQEAAATIEKQMTEMQGKLDTLNLVLDEARGSLLHEVSVANCE